MAGAAEQCWSDRVFDRLRRAIEGTRKTPRPLWQRLLYPVIGLVCIAFGLFAMVMPVLPGGFLLPIGFILLMCFHPRSERWARQRMLGLLRILRAAWDGSGRWGRRLRHPWRR